MARAGNRFAYPAPVAGFVLAGVVLSGVGLAGPARSEDHMILSPRIASMTAGLFCAPEEGDRRAAPDTMAGWIHVPDGPVEMVAEGQVAPALIGIGFGVRYTLRDTGDARVRYTVTHPPMPPSGMTTQSWDSVIDMGSVGTTFFQFDVPEEPQPGAWTFSASIDGVDLFNVGFTVRPAAELPALSGLCRGGALLSFSPAGRAAAG